jgi:hypothetical protein
MQARIRAVTHQQVGVRTLLHQLPALEHENTIGVLDGGDAAVFMEGGRLSRFMKQVDAVTAGIGLLLLFALANYGAELIAALAGHSGSPPR